MNKRELIDKLLAMEHLPDDAEVRVIADHGQIVIRACSCDIAWFSDEYYDDDWFYIGDEIKHPECYDTKGRKLGILIGD